MYFEGLESLNRNELIGIFSLNDALQHTNDLFYTKNVMLSTRRQHNRQKRYYDSY